MRCGFGFHLAESGAGVGGLALSFAEGLALRFEGGGEVGDLMLEGDGGEVGLGELGLAPARPSAGLR